MTCLSAQTLKKLHEVFNKFAGQEVLVSDVIYDVRDAHPRPCEPARRPVHRLEIAKNDPVMTELQKAIEDMGLTLCVRLPSPSYFGNFSMKPDRVNVYIHANTSDGKFRIPSLFTIG